MTSRGQALYARLDKSIEAELRKRSVFAISNYGWLDAYTADPDLIGHAMWQTDPPFNFAFDKYQEKSEPTDQQKQLTIVGADFEGLMELSRTSLGIVLWRQNEVVTDLFSDRAKYWAQYTGTLLTLSMASDRLRDFFVVAYFETDFSSFRSAKREFRSPFLEAKQRSHQVVRKQLNKLSVLIDRVQRNRLVRNKLVHQVATRPGRMNRELFNSRRGSSSPQRKKRMGTWDQWVSKTNREVAESSNFLVDWYKTLVDTSSLIFEIEHLLRRSRLERASAPAPDRGTAN